VKRRAILSIVGNPSCESEEMATKVVNEVWESCFKDTRPFDEVRPVALGIRVGLTSRYTDLPGPFIHTASYT
jgi:hypothetical protein